MCMFGGGNMPADTSAAQAEIAADNRKTAISSGQTAIDSAFAPFDDNYYKTYGDSYLSNYNPQVDTQYNQAALKQRYDLARKGTLDSTPAITAVDKLNQGYGQERQQIAAGAQSAVDSLKGSVAQQKSQLYSMNNSAADPTQAASNAAASAGTLPSTPQYSVLGDLFSGLVNGGSAYVAGQNKALPPGYNSVFAAGSGLPGGNGSGRVVS